MSRPLRVLIVDDEILIADYVAGVVEEAGHEVVGTAMNADLALRLASQAKPDVAILDIRLKGGRDGVELANDLQRTGLEIPHIFITGSGDPETRQRAEATQPLALLQKPFDSTKLLAALAMLSHNPPAGQ